MTPAIHSALRVMALGLVAGYVDAVGYVELHGIYTAAMTGNSTSFGIALGEGNSVRAAAVFTVLGLFFLGALAASLLRRSLRAYRHEWLWIACLLIVAQCIHWDHAAEASFHTETLLLTVAMAMQGEVLSRFSGISVQTIVVTNNIVKFADNIVGSLYRSKDHSSSFSLTAALPGLAWASCIAGAFLSVPIRQMTSGFFLFPVPFLAVLSFFYPASLEAET
ncbi:YoaK family protein [Acetobacter persici]|uniref:YoaK family protein n=1 Tax=Acetobacter persici TaxID=1076596 RepID=UPI0036DE6E06